MKKETLKRQGHSTEHLSHPVDNVLFEKKKFPRNVLSIKEIRVSNLFLMYLN